MADELEPIPMTDEQKADLTDAYRVFQYVVRTGPFTADEAAQLAAAGKFSEIEPDALHAGEHLALTMRSIASANGFDENTVEIADLILKARRRT
jgi:hypothetical protein